MREWVIGNCNSYTILKTERKLIEEI
jgi:hypothetical protein